MTKGGERMKSVEQVISEAVKRGKSYLADLEDRRVSPSQGALEALDNLDMPLQSEPQNALNVLDELQRYGSAATVASAGGRYFGFITGGSLPAALGANLLAACWDQNAVLEVASPLAARLERVCRKWLVDVLGFPAETGIGFVSGATMANFAGLAAARHALLADLDWDVEAQGLFGAPPIHVLVGDEVHVSALKALSMLGFGRERLTRIPVDNQGRMRIEAFSETIQVLDGPTILCLQAGNVNTGSFDPASEIIPLARQAGAWVHVDGAFGLWTAACPQRAHLFDGYADADSWATDAHKWLNVPYDSGLVFVRDPLHLRAAMSTSAAYLIEAGSREPSHYTPELSRRARGIEIWAALRSLGRSGLTDLVERCCQYAAWIAMKLEQAGYQILNEVVSNQVLVSFGSADQTLEVIQAVQEEGTCWAGSTRWQGHTAMRISVSSWATTKADMEKSLDAILRVAAEIIHP
jgi:glutamate/tyrosine decarboxylase-like PLP-dependent enzyme